MQLTLGRMLLLSGACHAAVLAAWQSAPPERAVPRLTVQLRQTPSTHGAAPHPAAPPPPDRRSEARPSPAAPTAADPHPPAPPRATAHPAPHPATRAAKPASAANRAPPREPSPQPPRARRPAPEPAPVTSAPEAAPAPETAPARTQAAGSGDAVRPRIRARLHDALARAFRYPMLARRRGWEGRVILSFRIGRHGDIGGVHVARSSGYRVLDRSALEALQGIGRLHGMERLLDNRDYDMQLPVVYRLSEG